LNMATCALLLALVLGIVSAQTLVKNATYDDNHIEFALAKHLTPEQ